MTQKDERLRGCCALFKPFHTISHSSKSLPLLLFDPKPASTQPTAAAAFIPHAVLHMKRPRHCSARQAKRASCHWLYTFPYPLIACFLCRSHTSATTGPRPSPCRAASPPGGGTTKPQVKRQRGDTVQHAAR